MYAYYCLHKFRWKPRDFVEMDRYQKAFVIAAIDKKSKQEEKENKQLKTRGRRR